MTNMAWSWKCLCPCDQNVTLQSKIWLQWQTWLSLENAFAHVTKMWVCKAYNDKHGLVLKMPLPMWPKCDSAKLDLATLTNSIQWNPWWKSMPSVNTDPKEDEVVFIVGQSLVRVVCCEGWSLVRLVYRKGWSCKGWSLARVVYCKGWSLVRVVCCKGWSLVRVVYCEGWSCKGWSLARVVYCKGWSLVRVVYCEGWSYCKGWSFVRLVYCKGGLWWGWSIARGLFLRGGCWWGWSIVGGGL